jgi:hypothetical protein
VSRLTVSRFRNRVLTISIGWSVCPSSIYSANSCSSDTSWTRNLDLSISMSTFKRYATVAYSGSNASILDIEAISAPNVSSSPAAGFRTAINALLTPATGLSDASNSSLANATAYTVLFTLCWGLRLFHDQASRYSIGPLDILQNILALPFQISTVALDWAAPSQLPPDVKTTATVAKITYRAIAERWTIFVYGPIAAFLILWAVGCLACAGHHSRPSSFPEFGLLQNTIKILLTKTRSPLTREALSLEPKDMGGIQKTADGILRKLGAGSAQRGRISVPPTSTSATEPLLQSKIDT